LIVVDTNVISELVKARPAKAVVDWLAEQETIFLHLSSISLGEIDLGARACPDARKRARLLAWCDRLQNVMFKDRVLPFDAACARVWGGIVQDARVHGRSLEWRSSQIAAVALRFEARVATRNTRHFRELGLELIDPFSG
jgi:predicted nucleic acid-binding protein